MHRRHNTALYNLAGVFVVAAVILAACSAKPANLNSALDEFELDLNDPEAPGHDVLAVIVNTPTQEQLDLVPNLTTLVAEKDGQTMLVLPRYTNTTLRLITLVYEDDTLKEDETVYETATGDGYGLFLTAFRPEGPPHFKLVVSSGDRGAEYIVSYDGKNGTPDVEYVREAGE